MPSNCMSLHVEPVEPEGRSRVPGRSPLRVEGAREGHFVHVLRDSNHLSRGRPALRGDEGFQPTKISERVAIPRVQKDTEAVNATVSIRIRDHLPRSGGDAGGAGGAGSGTATTFRDGLSSTWPSFMERSSTTMSPEGPGGMHRYAQPCMWSIPGSLRATR
jgi:hypothetical protein